MSPNRWCLLGLVALMPLTVQVRTNGDSILTVTTSRGTRIEVLGGVGEYAFVTRGCEGKILRTDPVSYREAGGAIEQGLGATGLSVGARGGWMRDDMTLGPALVDPSQPIPPAQRSVIENGYVNPYVTYERVRGSVGFGWIFHDKDFITSGEGARLQEEHPLNDFSAHLRVGSERRYMAIRWMEGVPLYSSGGYLTIGAGGHPGGGRCALYGGLGAGGPFEGAGIMFRAGYEFPTGLTASVRTRFGGSGTRLASGVAVGVGYGVIRP
jgi:hypothetical protein